MSNGRHAWRSSRAAWERLRDWVVDSGRHEAERALEALSDIRALRQVLDEAELAAVRAARRHGSSWSEIATRLSMTRQSAWERWRDLDESAQPSTTTTDGPTALEVHAAAAAASLVQHAATRRRRSNVIVPNLIGLTLDDARGRLLPLGLVAVGPDPDGPPFGQFGWPQGLVTDQAPEAGAKVPRASAVTVWLDTGDGEGGAGVREPRRPPNNPRTLRAMRDEPTDEAVG